MRSASAPKLETTITAYIPATLSRAATAAADERMTSISQYVRDALVAKLKADGVAIDESERVAV
jgi:hypothetical protein